MYSKPHSFSGLRPVTPIKGPTVATLTPCLSIPYIIHESWSPWDVKPHDPFVSILSVWTLKTPRFSFVKSFQDTCLNN